MKAPLRIEEFTKIYKLKNGNQRVAVDSVSVEVPSGVIFGFLGPNGAGKTTTIKAILDFIRPTKGKITVFGKPTSDPATRRMIGYLPEQPYFHKFLKPIEVVSMHAALIGISRNSIKEKSKHVLERCGLGDFMDTPISKLSKGLTQRVGVAQALIGEPDLLILDEPTSGLDPIGRRHIRDLLLELRDEGKTIFLSSHLLGEVENLCDIVSVLKSGKIVACNSPDLVRSGNCYVEAQTIRLDADTANRMRFMDVRVEHKRDSSVLIIDPANIYEIIKAMEQLKLPIHRIETKRESLEEAFLRLAA